MASHLIQIDKIMSILPHRYPFLLIDRVLECKQDEYIIGVKNVTANEPQFMGHFPGRPVMPGVLVIESMAQLSAVLVGESSTNLDNKEVFFMSIENAKFRKIITPGDQLIIKANMLHHRGAVWKFEAKAYVDDQVAAESVFTAMVRPKTEN